MGFAEFASGIWHTKVRYLVYVRLVGKLEREETDMYVTDPIADMLTRIRNAQKAKKITVEIPSSKMKKAIAEILLSEGYIKGVKYIKDDLQGKLSVTLKYADGQLVMQGLKRIKP